MHCFAWGIPQNKVPAMVDGDDGKVLYHRVVDRLYTKLRAILQAYMLGKQEEFQLPPCIHVGVSMRGTEGPPLHMHHVPTVCVHLVCRQGREIAAVCVLPARRSSSVRHTSWLANVRTLSSTSSSTTRYLSGGQHIVPLHHVLQQSCTCVAAVAPAVDVPAHSGVVSCDAAVVHVCSRCCIWCVCVAHMHR